MAGGLERDQDKLKAFNRRVLLIAGGKAALLGVLGTRLYDLSVNEAEHFSTLAEDNRINLRLLAPPRGLIVDAKGRTLAGNRPNFQLVLVAEKAEDVRGTLAQLSTMIALDESDIARVLKDVRNRPKFFPVIVRENLSWEEMARIEVNTPDLSGVSIEVGQVRDYPLGPATAHVIGYVGAVSEQELTGDPVEKLPGYKIGKSGVEKAINRALIGEAGASQVEVNAYGRVIRELSRDAGRMGDTVTLTLDAEMQMYTQARLGSEDSASAVVMDTQTGAIYALASNPSFDPNVFAKGIPSGLWRELMGDETKPLTNKVMNGEYPPGSTFKMCTAIAAIEEGVIDPGHTVFCPGHMNLGSFRFHCWKKGGHGTLGVVEALAQSCDTFFYDVARRMGIDRLAKWARKFGIGMPTNLDIGGDFDGLMPDSAWKKAKLGDVWHPGESLVNSIGQGYVLATPLQLAVMQARLVNGGVAVEPYLIDRVGGQKVVRPDFPKIGVSERTMALIREGMEAVTNRQTGTAFAARIKDPARAMGGKTGTAQVRRITLAERAAGVKNETLPWKHRHHALFVGYAPLNNPRYCCAVVVEHGVGGSKVAAPIARDLLAEVQRLDPARVFSVAEAAPAQGGDG
jgi:penicillin-binding protein 2